MHFAFGLVSISKRTHFVHFLLCWFQQMAREKNYEVRHLLIGNDDEKRAQMIRIGSMSEHRTCAHYGALHFNWEIANGSLAI